MDRTPDISVVIVSYNTRELTLRCLEHLYAGLGGLTAQVLVVDNASGDGSVSAIGERFPDVELIASERNLGFGAANNLAMERARGRFFLLLNSDAFVTPGAAHTLVHELEDRPGVGVVGPRLLNADGSTQPSCYRFPGPGRAWLENLGITRLARPGSRWGDDRRWAHDSAREVDWVIGACLAVRRSVVEEVGGFDPRFFMYQEETDWQRRVRAAGWSVWFTPEAEVTHLGGASGAGERARVSRQFFESLDRYQCKHHGLAGLVSLRLAMVAGGLLRLPCWAGAYVLRPARRAAAKGKLRLLGWLVVRQLCYWPGDRAGVER